MLKRGGLLAAANWPVVAIQFVAQTTFQALLAVPVIGAAILVAVLLGGDLGNLLQGTMREIFTAIANALMSEPLALIAFIAAFGIVLVGGSVLMFLIKGGVVDVMLAADEQAGPIEREALTLGNLRQGSCFDVERFVAACGRLFRRYLVLGMALMITYAVSGAAYLAFVIYGYRTAGESGFVIEWTLIAALSAVALVLWITTVNLLYLLLQIVTAIDDLAFGQAVRAVARFIRSEFLELGGVFLVVFGMVIGATFASALAWSGVGLIAFVPLVGLAVFPLADCRAHSPWPRVRVHRTDGHGRLHYALPPIRRTRRRRSRHHGILGRPIGVGRLIRERLWRNRRRHGIRQRGHRQHFRIDRPRPGGDDRSLRQIARHEDDHRQSLTGHHVWRRGEFLARAGHRADRSPVLHRECGGGP